MLREDLMYCYVLYNIYTYKNIVLNWNGKVDQIMKQLVFVHDVSVHTSKQALRDANEWGSPKFLKCLTRRQPLI